MGADGDGEVRFILRLNQVFQWVSEIKVDRVVI